MATNRTDFCHHSDHEAFGFCVHCELFLCDKCCKWHLIALKDHYLLNKDAMPKRPRPESQFGFCFQHGLKERGLDFFCIDHMVILCGRCIAFRHKQCEFIYIYNDNPKYKASLQICAFTELKSQLPFKKFTKSVIDFLMTFANVDTDMQRKLSFRNLTFGQKTLPSDCTSFTRYELRDINLSLADRYSQRSVCLRLLGPHLEKLYLNQTDFASETSEFSKLIILDIVCHDLVRNHKSIIEAYPSSEDTKVVLIAFTMDEKSDINLGQFRGFPVLRKPYLPNSVESIKAENYAYEKGLHCPSSDLFQYLDGVIESNTDDLFKNHSNLEGIGSSIIRSTRKAYVERLCIVLYCRCKSYIPYGEDPFPASILKPDTCISLKTDVREGYFQFGPNGNTLMGGAKDWHSELAIGCSVGPMEGHFSGTIGPFVEIQDKKETFFLTVRHIFRPLKTEDRRFQGVSVVQPADGDIRRNAYNLIYQRNQTDERTCGKVLICTLNDKVDAALIQIDDVRLPNRAYFVPPSEDELKHAGFSLENYPTFDDGSTEDAKLFPKEIFDQDNIVKFGKSTGLTKGKLDNYSLAVSTVDEEMTATRYDGQTERRVMKQQLKVKSDPLCAFFQLGDSGSAVFHLDEQKKMHCIGMAIGLMSDNSCVVTPIQTILSELKPLVKGKEIGLKNFQFELMQ